MASGEDSISVRKMDSEDDWRALVSALAPVDPPDPMSNILRHLKAGGIKSIVVENDYLDRDFSEEYTVFYAKLFRPHRRHARRMHFFRSDVSEIIAQEDAADIVTGLEAEQAAGNYAGFLIWRPMSEAPIGRLVLDVLNSWPGFHESLQVSATYDTHLLGARLSVSGIPFMEQDEQFTACGQAALWVVGRHFHAKHGGAWLSRAGIAEAAFDSHDVNSASSLPGGSGGLGLSNMIAVLRKMGLQPLLFHKRERNGEMVWPQSPASIIIHYLDSGLPVLLGVHKGGDDYHVVTAVGTAFRELEQTRLDAAGLSYADFFPFLLVNDDKRGINRRMPTGSNSSEGSSEETDYDLEKDVFFALMPIPQRVFVTAEHAETYSFDTVAGFYKDWPAFRTGLQDQATAAAGDAVAEALSSRQVLVRTYLRQGWKYKRWIAGSGAHTVLKARALRHELPRLVWVTEFAHRPDFNHLDPAQRRIFGHVVYDATAAGQVRNPLLMHVPGAVYVWKQIRDEYYGRAEPDVFRLDSDLKYVGRYR
ncbi:hypothetical protein [Bradyrhizobium sp. HKCCYLR20261]|uniref:hypothetical protein n=1 Tax=Bradyrhizobium sp. HKCCYLR20261 TaxID=3420760 RepID=UPI003EBEFF46